MATGYFVSYMTTKLYIKNMNEEKIIRKEAMEFFDRKIEGSIKVNAIDDFHELKHRLNDFYSPENKAIFLDEIELQLKDNLEEHRIMAHGGQESPSCEKEIKAEKLLFYIKQEIDTFPIIAHQKFESNKQVIRDKVFVSYSHLDKEFLTDVQRHFKPFLSKIDYWDDSKINLDKNGRKKSETLFLQRKLLSFL